MSDIMAQIGWFEWVINTIDTTQVNNTWSDIKATGDKMEKGTYESNLWQHNDLPFVFFAWSNNTIVKSLSNFYSPVIILDGVQQQIKINKIRQYKQIHIPVPLQDKKYSKMFYLINKGNGTKSK